MSHLVSESNTNLEMRVVMGRFGSGPQFKPEPDWTGPAFGPRSGSRGEPDLKSGSRLSDLVTLPNLSKLIFETPHLPSIDVPLLLMRFCA